MISLRQDIQQAIPAFSINRGAHPEASYESLIREMRSVDRFDPERYAPDLIRLGAFLDRAEQSSRNFYPLLKRVRAIRLLSKEEIDFLAPCFQEDLREANQLYARFQMMGLKEFASLQSMISSSRKIEQVALKIFWKRSHRKTEKRTCPWFSSYCAKELADEFFFDQSKTVPKEEILPDPLGLYACLDKAPSQTGGPDQDLKNMIHFFSQEKRTPLQGADKGLLPTEISVPSSQIGSSSLLASQRSLRQDSLHEKTSLEDFLGTEGYGTTNRLLCTERKFALPQQEMVPSCSLKNRLEEYFKKQFPNQSLDVSSIRLNRKLLDFHSQLTSLLHTRQTLAFSISAIPDWIKEMESFSKLWKQKMKLGICAEEEPLVRAKKDLKEALNQLQEQKHLFAGALFKVEFGDFAHLAFIDPLVEQTLLLLGFSPKPLLYVDFLIKCREDLLIESEKFHKQAISQIKKARKMAEQVFSLGR